MRGVKMKTKEAIEWLDNDILTLSIIDRKVDEFYDKIKNVKSLLQRGEELEGKYVNREAELFLIIKKTRKYKKMWKELYEIASEFNFFPLMDKIKQKYFPEDEESK